MQLRWFLAALWFMVMPLFFHSTTICFAASPPPVEETVMRERLRTAIDVLYEMKLGQALVLFDDIIKTYPRHPTPYLCRSMVFLWRFFFDYSQPDLKKFMAASETTINIAESALDANEHDHTARVTLGLTYGFRGLVNIRAENFVKGTLDIRSCYSTLKTALQRDPSQTDAYLGLGMFHFILGALPKNTRWLAGLAGLQGDRERGLQEIRRAAEQSLLFANDAKMVLGVVNVYYNNDYTTGLRYLHELLQKYPNSIPMLYTIGNVQASLKKLPLAIEFFQRAREHGKQLGDTNFRAFLLLTNYRLGEAYFRLNDFTAAKRYFREFVLNQQAMQYERAYRTHAVYRLALIEELEGRRREAVKGYTKIGAMTALDPEDRYAQRKAKELLQQPLTEQQKALILGVNCIESQRWQEGQEILQPLASSAALPADIRAEAAYYLGEAARRQQKTGEATTWYNKAPIMQAQRETWIAPWSYYRIAEMMYNDRKSDEARKYLDKARAFSRFDFEEWLIFALERDMTLLK